MRNGGTSHQRAPSTIEMMLELPCSSLSPASLHIPCSPPPPFLQQWHSQLCDWPSQKLIQLTTTPSEKLIVFQSRFFLLPHSHAFEALNINTSHGKVVIWGVTKCSKKLLISLRMIFSSLFCCFCYPDI